MVLQFFPEYSFQGMRETNIVSCHKCKSVTGFRGASRSADAMSISIRGRRHIIINDM